MNLSVPTAPTGDNIARVTSLLADTPKELARLSQGLKEESLRQPLGNGERSLTGCLAHLLNSEARTSEAIYLALLTDEPLLPGIHSERHYGRLLRYDRLDFPDLLAYFKVRRALMLGVLNSPSEGQWSRTTRAEGKRRRESVYNLARLMALHEVEHLEDLKDKIERLLKP